MLYIHINLFSFTIQSLSKKITLYPSPRNIGVDILTLFLSKHFFKTFLSSFTEI